VTASYQIQGHAIVSKDDMIADATGSTPAALHNAADWQRFQAALDRAAVVVLGRDAHFAHPNIHRRTRLVLSSTARGVERRADAWWWNPAQAPLADALAAAAPAGGIVAVPGGRRVFDLFLEHGFDEFHLARAHGVRIPDGVPIFSECGPQRSAEEVLAARGLVPEPTELLDAVAAVSVTVWKRHAVRDAKTRAREAQGTRKDRAATNPCFNSRKLKLGTFQTNLESGCVMSDLEGRLRISWPATIALARLADEMEFEALVPVARWQGFAGATNPQGPGFEAYTWAAGISTLVEKPGIIATSHVSLNHPIMAAKQGAVIDHISGGRFTLNIVTGWNKPEIDMFGAPMLPHAERYDCSEEWVQIVKRLWTEEPFDFAGKYYKIEKGYLEPKPIQAPYPAIMNAASSERGRHFAAKYCDLVYTVVRGGGANIDDYRAHVAAYHRLAREEYGRKIRVWSLVNIVQGETEKEARDFFDYYVRQKGDWDAAKNVVDTFALDINARNLPPDRMRAMQEAMIASWGGFNLVGTKEQIVDGLERMSGAGLDGVLLCWPRFESGMREFRDVTYPLLKQAGLRDFPT
jgi:alkanesulfonate monooxygenase SsuD/methylene tetrahydromethanopterin reductase-like flavin-dependent oxidoreductase (luciferase family)/dihydrofolate reductase